MGGTLAMKVLLGTTILALILIGTPSGGLMAADRLSAAVDAYAHGDLPAAQTLLENLRMDPGPNGGRAAYLLGVVNLQQKRFGEAAAAFSDAGHSLQILADHAAYYQAVSVFDMGDFTRAADMFHAVATRFPESTLRGLGLFWRAESLWGARSPDAPDAFHRYLESFGDGRHAAQAWFEMGQALEQQDKWADAVQAYRRIIVVFDSTPYGDPARARLAALSASHTLPPDLTPPDAFYHRGLAAIDAGDWRTARDAFLHILAMPGGWIDADGALYNLGVLAFQGRSLTVAADYFRQDLNLRQAHADDALYYLERIALTRGREGDALTIARTIAQQFPKSSLAARSIYAIAEVRADHGALGPALGLYREAAERFPGSQWGSEARWRIGWIAYRQHQWATAHGAWLQLANEAPGADAAPQSLYWAARAAAAMSRADLFADAYRRAAQQYPDTYYGQLAAARLGIPLRVAIQTQAPEIPTGDILAYDRFRELDALAQTEDATAELAAAAKTAPAQDRVQLGALLSLRYAQQDQVRLAIRTAELVREEAGLAPGRALPLALWQALYPQAHWQAITQGATRAGVDPYLVAGLIREESRFDAQAVSPAGAYGLMQVIPATARTAARYIGMPVPNVKALNDPATNVALGTVVLAEGLRRFGRVDMALAAYNAGPDIVRRWQAQRGWMDPDAFVEEIPYLETRNYVKTVEESAAMYRWLYRDGHPTGPP